MDSSYPYRLPIKSIKHKANRTFRQDLIRRLLIASLLFLIMRYLMWRTFGTLNFTDPVNRIFSMLLLAAEILVFANSILQLVLAFNTTDRRPQADLLEQDVLSGQYQPSVDILVPSYDEPAFILRRTLIGIQALNYHNYQLYLLDDTNRPEICVLAAELGCHYITRPDNRHAKAGNLNHAISQTNGELIVCFDADFIPTQNFLQRTLGFFQDPTIALLQTPQTFYNPDPIARNLGLSQYLPPEEEIFYRYIQPMRDAAGAVVCAGTSFIVRRSALAAIGGFVTKSLSEDYFTGIKLNAQAYHSVYLNEKLSAGLAAESIATHISQRLRWAQGTLQALFLPTNPLTIPGLTLRQRLAHLEGILHWFTSFARLYFLCLPVLYACFGIVPIVTTADELLWYLLPLQLGQFASFRYLNRQSRSAVFSDLYSLVLLFPLVQTILQTLINPFGKGFKVTPKGICRDRPHFHLSLATPLIGLFGLNVYSLFYILQTPPTGIPVSWVWSVYNLLTLGVAVLAFRDSAQRPIVSPMMPLTEERHYITQQYCQPGQWLDPSAPNELKSLVLLGKTILSR